MINLDFLPKPKTVKTFKPKAKAKTFVWTPQVGEKVVYLHTDEHGKKKLFHWDLFRPLVATQ